MPLTNLAKAVYQQLPVGAEKINHTSAGRYGIKVIKRSQEEIVAKLIGRGVPRTPITFRPETVSDKQTGAWIAGLKAPPGYTHFALLSLVNKELALGFMMSRREL